ncbi:MAG TPA: A/G-specific adenine glycosylase, partial [Candidatus Woesebacteria bacterium]|nr:A/G-specific adenine glycosylase [Candidatus Woesebacteria bacterium]
VFPDFQSLAKASNIDLLRVWQGMGYNRRALYVREIAKIISEKYNGVVPQDPDMLDAMPGIGPATARSIIVYTYNKPELFIETNVRRVFIHHFFEDTEGIADSEIFPILDNALDKKNPREWYYAVMDYGTWLGRNIINPNRKSTHYVKQSKFEGSKRQVRGAILKELVKGDREKEDLLVSLGFEKERVYDVLRELEKEGFVAEKRGKYKIK